uniref:CSON004955 protein n=1 Tax=Culicoides sonorensis TaxID=179676 RepID=A0A336MVZ7_CULSO
MLNKMSTLSTNRFYYFTTIILVLTQTSIGFCPSKCTCEGDYNLRTSCLNAGLEVVPIQLNPDIKYINLTQNHIKNVYFTLTFYYKLQVLDISFNQLDDLGSKNFESQEKLYILMLNDNQLISLKKDAFRGLKELVELNLSNNRIEEIHHTAFNDLIKLIRLDMSNNQVVRLDGGVLRHLVSLDNLNFRNNQILDVPYEDNLEHLVKLSQLDLSANFIENVNNYSFDQMHQLRLLNLSRNVINDFDLTAFDGLSGLKTLDLADNNLTVVPTLQISKLSNLTNLVLSGNPLTQIPPVAFLNLFQLRELQLNNLPFLIKIDARAFIDNTNLRKLELENNIQFSELPLRLFHGNPNLVDISIRGNKLHTLDAIQFPLDNLQRLMLANNPLECNCSLLWLWRLVTENDVSSDKSVTSTTTHHEMNNLIIDRDEIACFITDDSQKIKKPLRKMYENEINCPAHLITIISAILTLLLVAIVVISMLYYMKVTKQRKHIVEEAKNVCSERIVPQKIDRVELERYLAQQTIANDYHALRPWEVPIKDAVKFNEINEPDHYEHFEYYDRKGTLHKPHVVYV